MADNGGSQATKRPLPEDAKALDPLLAPQVTVKQVSHEEVKQHLGMELGRRESKEKAEDGKAGTGVNKNGEVEEEQANQYRRMKFQGELYDLGETVFIRESESSNMVGRIEKIIKENGDPKHPKWPMIEVAWFAFSLIRRFYKKSDIAREASLPGRELSWIGENEVFETNCVSKIYADLLEGKCKVWDIEAYDGQSGLGNADFYTRARYDIDRVYDIVDLVEGDKSSGRRVGKDVYVQVSTESSRSVYKL